MWQQADIFTCLLDLKLKQSSLLVLVLASKTCLSQLKLFKNKLTQLKFQECIPHSFLLARSSLIGRKQLYFYNSLPFFNFKVVKLNFQVQNDAYFYYFLTQLRSFILLISFFIENLTKYYILFGKVSLHKKPYI